MQHQNPAMTFTEIGQRLGVSRQCVEQTFRRALKKIRRNPEAMANFQFIAHEKDKLRYQTWRLTR